MGRTHFNCFKQIRDVQVVAVCDVDKQKWKTGQGTTGNLSGLSRAAYFKGVELYSSFDKMLSHANLDALSIALPTYLHCEYTLKALGHGLHVLCEKPMALDLPDCRKMISAMKKNRRILQIGHCIRFWPEYAKAKEIIESGKYGKLKAASFRRLSSMPVWTWDDWLLDGERSGGALMDLHIHDTDFVHYVFGWPQAVSTRGLIGPSGKLDHLVTHYLYAKDRTVITAEGGWLMAPGFGFEMSFNIMLEGATLAYDCNRPVPFRICLGKGAPVIPKLDRRSGHQLELIHFVNQIQGTRCPKVLSAIDSLNTIRLILAEEESARIGKAVRPV